VVRGMGTTIGNLNTTNQQLMQSASKFVDDTNANAKRVSGLNDVINQNVSKLNQVMDSYQELEAEAKEGFSDMGASMDAALEVSDTVKESHKYALVIFGIFATYALYRTIKQLTIVNN
jgi:methyl-accepting chemotaxis protein